jgi:hypothetical protein
MQAALPVNDKASQKAAKTALKAAEAAANTAPVEVRSSRSQTSQRLLTSHRVKTPSKDEAPDGERPRKKLKKDHDPMTANTVAWGTKVATTEDVNMVSNVSRLYSMPKDEELTQATRTTSPTTRLRARRPRRRRRWRPRRSPAVLSWTLATMSP